MKTLHFNNFCVQVTFGDTPGEAGQEDGERRGEREHKGGGQAEGGRGRHERTRAERNGRGGQQQARKKAQQTLNRELAKVYFEELAERDNEVDYYDYDAEDYDDYYYYYDYQY